MHNDISNIFDSPPVSPVSQEASQHHWLSLPLAYRRAKENGLPSSRTYQQAGSSSKSYNKAHNSTEHEEKESITPQLRELKKESLAFFRKWQTTILARLRDTTVADPNVAQGDARGHGRGGIRGAFRGRGSERAGRGGSMNRAGLTLATGKSKNNMSLSSSDENEFTGPPRIPTQHLDAILAKRCHPIPNTLWSLPLEKRKQLFHLVFLVCMSMSEYTANTYLLLLNLASSLNLPLKFFYSEEARMAEALAQAALDMSPEELLSQKAEEAKGSSRRNKGPGSSTTLAPALASAGIGTIQGSYGLTGCAAAGLLGPLAEGGRAMCNLFGMNPAKPTSKMMEVFAREIQDFGLLPIHDPKGAEYIDSRAGAAQGRRMRIVIAMGGWVTEDEDVRKPWMCLSHQTEAYALRWDSLALLNLGNSLETVIRSSAWSSAKKEISARTSTFSKHPVSSKADLIQVFTSLIESVWPVPLLKISKIMDNPWSVGMVRAEKAGAVLADAIMRHRFQGERPVSLVGYGLAARAIYACLMVLAERRQFGTIESVIVMGAPVPSESRVWLTLKSVVSGRLVNVYSEHDYLLGFLYRFSNTQFGVAGLQEIQGAEGVESHDAGDLPRGHLGYDMATARILKELKWDDLDEDASRSDLPQAIPKRKRGGRGKKQNI